MRIQSKTTTVKYAGRFILVPGDTLNGEAFSGTRNYTTSTTALVMSESPALDNYGNAEGTQSLSISRDFGTFEELLTYLLQTQDFADKNQRGDLTITSGEATKTVAAGLTSLSHEISLAASYRLTLTWEFVTI